VHDFWNAASCGEIYAQGTTAREQLAAQARARYALEPYLSEFARFEDARGRDVLEIGVGMGADHLRWRQSSPRTLTGVDLTPRALNFTRARLLLENQQPRLLQGDAERLPFTDDSFDLVYSWGVLHHTPDTPHAIREVHRVLRPGGRSRIMIYHRRSIVGAMLWLRYAVMTRRFRRTLDDVYAEHLESPGTKAYSIDAARRLFDGFSYVAVRVQLSFADLLLGEAGRRHGSGLMRLARSLWPRWLLRRAAPNSGLYLFIDAQK
jgi:SAM-dependent methyltransferase